MNERKGETVRLKSTTDSPQAHADSDDYDPHEHRNLSNPTNNVETLIHLLKCSLGTGILAMPQAFGNSGLVTGIVSTVVAGAIITHCLKVLIKSQYAVCKLKHVPQVTYPDTMTFALLAGPPFMRRLAKPSAATVDTFLVVYQLGICCVYIVFIADNIKKLVDPVQNLSIKLHMMFILVPLMLINMIPNLKMLAPFSLLANLLTMAGLSIVVYYLVALPSLDDNPLDLWGSVSSFPLFFGTVLFALTAVGVVVSLENNMKTPKSFHGNCGVLNQGMVFIVVIYVLVGALGYNFCSGQCKDSITLNLPQGALATSVIVMYTIAIFISYGLQCYVPVEIVWRDYVKPRLVRRGVQRLTLAEYVVRVVLCVITFLLAVAIPRLGLFISLFGAMCLSALGICFPAMMELCIKWPDKLGPYRSIMYKDIILFVVGLVGLVAGTYTSLFAIVASFT